MVVPDAMQALQAVGKSVHKSGLSAQTVELVNLRASQINGCSVCVEMHSRALKKAGESDERLFAVAAWRETPYFSEAERAALALTTSPTNWRRRFAAYEGARVVLTLADGSCLDECELVSAGRGPNETVWVVTDGSDLFVSVADVVDVQPSESAGSRGAAA
jgi:AhpD family alkylhydroperoxidase